MAGQAQAQSKALTRKADSRRGGCGQGGGGVATALCKRSLTVNGNQVREERLAMGPRRAQAQMWYVTCFLMSTTDYRVYTPLVKKKAKAPNYRLDTKVHG
jgi:hypothetical protein